MKQLNTTQILYITTPGIPYRNRAKDGGRAGTHADSRAQAHTACAQGGTVVQTDMEHGWHGFSKTAKILVFPF